MTDANDAIDEARILTKKAAAAALARKEAAEQEIKRLESAREIDSEAREQRLSLKREELAIAEDDYRTAMTDLRDLERVKKDHARNVLRAVVDGAVSSDPFSRESAADRALENVRNHAMELEARVELDQDLNARREGSSPPVAPPRDRDAEAREKLAQLKAERGRAAKPASGTSDGERDPSAPPPPKKKRTL